MTSRINIKSGHGKTRGHRGTSMSREEMESNFMENPLAQAQDGFGKETKEIEMGNLNPMWNASKQGGGSMKPRLPKTARTNAKGEMRQAAKLGRKDHGMLEHPPRRLCMWKQDTLVETVYQRETTARKRGQR